MDNLQFTLSGVYGKHSVQRRRELWEHLRFIHSSINGPSMWGGDFNTISSIHDRLGGAPPQPLSMEEFNECINDYHMAPVITTSNKYTCCDNRKGHHCTWQILDRVLQSSDLLLLWGLLAQALFRSFSDHSPIIVSWRLHHHDGPRPWRYQRMWARHENFTSMVHHRWKQPRAQSPLADISLKLKYLRQILKQWNISTFGNIFAQKNDLESAILSLESSLQAAWSQTTHDQLLEKKSLWREIFIREEIFWKQKFRIKWLMEGDANSRFFHAIVKSKSSNAKIEALIGPNNENLQGHNAIHDAAVTFFAQLFTSKPHHLKEELLNLIPLRVQAETNTMLLAPFNIKELHQAVSSIPTDSAPGIDGFPSSFFTAMWDIIGESILAAANELLSLKILPAAITHTSLVHIPKSSTAKSLNDFRPISLCTTL